MAITKAGTTITVEYEAGDAKGDSFSNPYRMSDILQADIDNGWGVIENIGNTYHIKANITLADSTTFVYINGENLIWEDADYDNDHLLDTNTCNLRIYNSHLSPYTSRAGDIRLGLNTSDPYDLNVINTSFTLLQQVYFYGGHYKNIQLNKNQFNNIPSGNYVYLNNIQLNGYGDTVRGNGLKPLLNAQEANNITISNCAYAVMVYGASGTYRNLKLINNTNDLLVLALNDGRVMNFIDSEVNFESMYILPNYNGNQTLNNISSFNFDIKNSIGGEIVLYDKDGIEIYSHTMSTENVSEEILFRSIYMRSTSSEGIVEYHDNIYQPFTLKVIKAGYQTLTIPDIMITAGQSTNIRGELVPIEELNPVGFTNQAETEVLRHLFLNEDILNIGDTAGLLASSQEGNFYIALFTGDPGETGSTTSEATYTGYARASVSRGDTGWYEGMGIARNINPINFPECMGGEETITHYAIMKENTGDKMLCYGELQDPINIVKTSQPQFGPYSIEFRLN